MRRGKPADTAMQRFPLTIYVQMLIQIYLQTCLDHRGLNVPGDYVQNENEKKNSRRRPQRAPQSCTSSCFCKPRRPRLAR